ncbi:MAG TPA: sigma-70 family RNA polymerase sigma factor [Chitinophagales bacterium]|nr:sigma-70 family RNA polymerase sigma factor [Chitinophagales bacterium]HNL84080.1 sigma-70 family RNA polymerase sigma factor [Chitinophagales bacterium]
MYPIVLSDNELVQNYINGDQQALAQLLNKYQRKVFSFILIKLKDRTQAEDIFQETFFKVIDSLQQGRYNEEGKFLPWVLMIAHNLCMDYFRKNKRMPNTVDVDSNVVQNSMGLLDENREDKIMRQQTADTLRDMIDKLPPDQKEVLILRHYADMSFKEIAEMTGTNINTALGRMRYALLNLKKMIGNKIIVM